MGPGGAPPPPECLDANQARGAPCLVPPIATPRESALKEDEVTRSLGEAGEAGISW